MHSPDAAKNRWDDRDSLKAAFLKLCDDALLRTAMGRNGERTAAAFSLERMAGEVARVLMTV